MREIRFSSFSFPPKDKYKIKRASTVVNAPKNANPDCRQTNLIELEYLYHNHYSEFALLPNSKNDYGKKMVCLSHKEKDTTNSIIKFVWHNYCITIFAVCKHI